MPYDIKVDPAVFDAVIGTVKTNAVITRDGQLYGEGGWMFYGTSQAAFDEHNADMIEFVAKHKLTGLDYKGLLKVESDLYKLMEKWGKDHDNKGKGK